MAFEAKYVDKTKLPKDLITLLSLSSLVRKVAIPREQMDVSTSRLKDHFDPKP